MLFSKCYFLLEVKVNYPERRRRSLTQRVIPCPADEGAPVRFLKRAEVIRFRAGVGGIKQVGLIMFDLCVDAPG